MSIKDRIILFTKYKQISVKAFEDKCGMSNGYVNAMRKGLGTEKLNNVLTAFPDINRDWLLYGEGDMLLPSDHSPVINGDGNTQVVGNSNNVNGGDVLAKTLAEMKDLIRQQMESNSILVESNRMLVDSNKKLVDLLADKCSS